MPESKSKVHRAKYRELTGPCKDIAYMSFLLNSHDRLWCAEPRPGRVMVRTPVFCPPSPLACLQVEGSSD